MARVFAKDYYKKFAPAHGVPEYIYKYCPIDDNLKSSLAEGYLWFSKPADFNDPFDCYTTLVDFADPKDYIKQLIMERFPGNRQERQLRSKEFGRQPKRVKNLYRTLTEQSISKIGICCFSTDENSTLLWSHYAAKHSGICLVFDPSVDLSYFLIAGINYTEEFKPYNYFDQTEDALFWMVITKAEGWRYEQEVRIISLEKNGKRPFPKAGLKRIIFGCRTHKEQINEIKQIITEANYQSLIFQQAVQATNGFHLTFKDV